MREQEFFDLVQSISYKPGWHVRAYCERRFSEWVMSVHITAQVNCSVLRDGSTVYVNFVEVTPVSHIHTLTLEGAKRFLHAAFIHAETHEVGEWLMFGQEKPFDPHARDFIPLAPGLMLNVEPLPNDEIRKFIRKTEDASPDTPGLPG